MIVQLHRLIVIDRAMSSPPQPLVVPGAGLERALAEQEAVHQVLEAGGGEVVLRHGQVLLLLCGDERCENNISTLL